ncbi:hypothetical protein Agub_g1517 [Astrephomene gubernaculifera]|uniref:Uncharacterized protein n=1 Tax=Astrephomene gubernaculifera TaxID=47775 RepID=A0AAD3HHK9_9CHLO|nr:hypothetical protein Agub_g1517 [Astrephomene gubernaculifera]
MGPAFEVPSSYRGSKEWCLKVADECQALDCKQGVVSYVVADDHDPKHVYSFSLARTAQFKHLRAMVATSIPFFDPETACLTAKYSITQADGSCSSYALAEDSHYDAMLSSLRNNEAVITLLHISSPEGLSAMWLFKDDTTAANSSNNKNDTSNNDTSNNDTSNNASSNNGKPGLFQRLRRSVGKAALIGTVAVVGAVAAPVVATAALGAAGFSASGVVAGSAAAAWQASIGNVAAGSMFAFLQSAGAGGAAAATFGSAATAAGAAIGTGAGVAVAMKTGGKKPSGDDASGDAPAAGEGKEADAAAGEGQTAGAATGEGEVADAVADGEAAEAAASGAKVEKDGEEEKVVGSGRT